MTGPTANLFDRPPDAEMLALATRAAETQARVHDMIHRMSPAAYRAYISDWAAKLAADVAGAWD